MIDEEVLKNILWAKVMAKNHNRDMYWKELTYEEVCMTINECVKSQEKAP